MSFAQPKPKCPKDGKEMCIATKWALIWMCDVECDYHSRPLTVEELHHYFPEDDTWRKRYEGELERFWKGYFVDHPELTGKSVYELPL